MIDSSDDDDDDETLLPDAWAEPVAGGGGAGGVIPPAASLSEAPNGGDGRDEREEDQTGWQGDAPECLEALVDAVMGLQAPKLHDLKGIIATGVRQNLTPAEMAYLRDVIAATTDVTLSVSRQLEADIRNTDSAHGVLHTVALFAKSAIAKLRKDFTALVFSEGHLWSYVPFADGNVTGEGRFQSRDPEAIADFLLEEFGELPAFASKATRDEVARRIISELRQPAFFSDAPSGINLLNGFLTFEHDKRDVFLLPPGPEHKARWRLEVPYDPEAKAPTFMAGLARTFPDLASAEVFGESVGCALLNVTPGTDDARRALWLVGPPKSGKSTLLDVIKLIVPDYAVTAIPPTVWSQPYMRAALAGKMLNVVAELGKKQLIAADLFKTIVGHEEVSARLPYKEPFTFRPKAWHIFATNSIPRTDDRDLSFERRCLAIRLTRSIPPEEVDADYLAKVNEELTGVVAWFIGCAVRAMNRGHFVLLPGHKEIIAEMQHGDDLFARFAISMVEKASDTEPALSTKAINAALMAFARREGLPTVDWKPTTGARRLAGLLRDLYGATQCQVAGVPHYRGVRLKREG